MSERTSIGSILQLRCGHCKGLLTYKKRVVPADQYNDLRRAAQAVVNAGAELELAGVIKISLQRLEQELAH